ncbi:MAG: hypothetical protein MI739_02510 [Bacteroidales bacterium]|nr:hypothetical protein [Bacteroidales bacterium]
MFEILKSSIDALKKKVQNNLDLITQSEKQIRELLKEPMSKERSNKLNQQFDYNAKLLEENKEALAVQRKLINFLKKYKIELDAVSDIFEDDDDAYSVVLQNNLNRDEYMDLTKNEIVDFNKKHPYFNDESFLNELLEHFSKSENYEMCAKLIGEKKNNRTK